MDEERTQTLMFRSQIQTSASGRTIDASINDVCVREHVCGGYAANVPNTTTQLQSQTHTHTQTTSFFVRIIISPTQEQDSVRSTVSYL